MFADLFRPRVIVGALPNNLTNGTTADATQVMADLNWIVNQVNANAAPLASAALVNANNNFTAVQSGQAATQAANFPIASQVANWAFNTLSSTLGTNTLTARVAALALPAYAVGQVFTFVPSQANTGSATLNIDGLGSAVLQANGAQLVGGELGSTTAMVRVTQIGAQPKLDLLNPFLPMVIRNQLAADVTLNNTGLYFVGPRVSQGTVGTWLAFGTVTCSDTAGSARFDAKLSDGTTVYATTQGTSPGGNDFATLSLSWIIERPAGDIRIEVKDGSSTNGRIDANDGVNGNINSSLTVIRIA